ncbi:MAG: N-acetyltransferase [Deltaproteobacteria bacterium]|jgi:phosphinothricin acetyltransferase|nr:N-acetyltransferase [Deltaproteobacteria bacterium]
MNARIRPVAATDWGQIADIFNYYVIESLAAYPDQPVSEAFFRDRQGAHPEYPFVVAEAEEGVVGFAYLSPFHPARTMRHTASLTYFLHPQHTGRGIGTELLEHLFDGGKSIGVTNFTAHISSENPGSVRFHQKHGFTECGRFVNVGIKKGRRFDMVWMQRELCESEGSGE